MIIWDKNENYDLDTSVSYKMDNPLLELILSCPHFIQALTTVILNETTTTIQYDVKLKLLQFLKR